MPSRIVFLGLYGSVITALLSNGVLSRCGISNGHEGLRLQLMNDKNEIRSVEMVLRIRDEIASILEGKSRAEIIAFLKKAGDVASQFNSTLL